jgi:uncharacterized protein (DUF58 family)
LSRVTPDPRILARLSGLELRAKAVVSGWLAGRHRSPRKGFSVEFAEHREYSPGDDLRYLDWKVYGKRDRFQVKQFEAETNLGCAVLVDVSESMTYRSAGAPWSKLECAQTAAAALAYLVLRQNDAIGCSVFDRDAMDLLRPSGKAAQWSAVIRMLEQGRPRTQGVSATGGAANPFAALHELAERLPPRSVVAVFSDCLGPLDELLGAFKHLRHARHDLIVFQVVDPAEEDFPFEGMTMFQGLEGLGSETLDPHSLRDAYQAEFADLCRRISTASHDMGGDYERLRTDLPLDGVLAAFLARR